MMEFSFNTLSRYFSITSLLKCASDFTADIFLSEKEVFSWTYLLEKTPSKKDKNINISNLKEDFKNLRHTFWAHKYSSVM